jgi:hypothetical protein
MVGYNEIRTIPGSLNHQACARDGISAFSSFYYDKQLVENNVKLKVEKEVEPTSRRDIVVEAKAITQVEDKFEKSKIRSRLISGIHLKFRL